MQLGFRLVIASKTAVSHVPEVKKRAPNEESKRWFEALLGRVGGPSNVGTWAQSHSNCPRLRKSSVETAGNTLQRQALR